MTTATNRLPAAEPTSILCLAWALGTVPAVRACGAADRRAPPRGRNVPFLVWAGLERAPSLAASGRVTLALHALRHHCHPEPDPNVAEATLTVVLTRALFVQSSHGWKSGGSTPAHKYASTHRGPCAHMPTIRVRA